MDSKEGQIVKVEYDDSSVLVPVMDLKTAQARLAQFQEFVKGYLKEDEDYGTIPGTPKPTLYKPGADKLCELYGLSDEYEIVPEYSREDWTMIPPLFDYTVRCILKRKKDSSLVATGMGSCNSYEGKYRWRDLKRTCPECGKATIIKGKEEYGGGYLCWKKEGKSDGCGAKFADDDQRITGQVIGRTENDDIATLKNTILKMSKKRAKVDATLSATRSSGIFTQDVEDITTEKTERPKQQPVQQPQRTSQTASTIQVITEEQRKEIFSEAAKVGFPGKAEVSAFLLGQFGCKTSAEIPVEKFPAVIEAIKAWKPGGAANATSSEQPATKGKGKKKEEKTEAEVKVPKEGDTKQVVGTLEKAEIVGENGKKHLELTVAGFPEKLYSDHQEWMDMLPKQQGKRLAFDLKMSGKNWVAVDWFSAAA